MITHERSRVRQRRFKIVQTCSHGLLQCILDRSSNWSLKPSFLPLLEVIIAFSRETLHFKVRQANMGRINQKWIWLKFMTHHDDWAQLKYY